MQWDLAQRLLRHAAGLDACAAAASTLDAIAASRSLLDDPDPVAPVVGALTDALRDALGDRLAAFDDCPRRRACRARGIARLVRTRRRSGRRRSSPRSASRTIRRPRIGTTSELLATLDGWPLADWQVRIDAIAAQAAKAHELAARETARDAVVVKPAAWRHPRRRPSSTPISTSSAERSLLTSTPATQW